MEEGNIQILKLKIALEQSKILKLKITTNGNRKNRILKLKMIEFQTSTNLFDVPTKRYGIFDMGHRDHDQSMEFLWNERTNERRNERTHQSGSGASDLVNPNGNDPSVVLPHRRGRKRRRVQNDGRGRVSGGGWYLGMARRGGGGRGAVIVIPRTGRQAAPETVGIQ